jgi:hypothetical protein
LFCRIVCKNVAYLKEFNYYCFEFWKTELLTQKIRRKDMIFVWRGWGFVVPLIWFVSLWIAQIGVNTVFGGGTYESYGIFKIIASVPIGIGVWVVGNLLNENITSIRNRHSLFFIPVEHWGAIIPILTIVMTIIF